MVDQPQPDAEDRLDVVFHALADRTRRSLLRRLAAEPGCSVTELAEPFDMSLNAVSKHLKVLERAGLLERSRDGRVHRCSANLVPVMEATKTLVAYEAFWNARFDDLEAYLAEKDR
jgi:DNA-binding transcriptional ArsR family regulator